MDQDELRRGFTRGQELWPSVKLNREHFLEHCQQFLSDTSPEDLRRFEGDLFLCAACARGDGQAIRVFDLEVLPLTVNAVRGINSSAAFVDDVMQTVRQKLFVGERAKIVEYRGRGPLVAWLRTIATRTALDAIRAHKNQPQGSLELPERLLKDEFNPVKRVIQSQYLQPFQDALKRGVAALSSRDRGLLRMHLVGRCNIDQIGTTYGVHRATAARWLRAARESVFDFVRSELKTNHNLTDGEFASIARGIQSKLDIEISASFSETNESNAARGDAFQ